MTPTMVIEAQRWGPDDMLAVWSVRDHIAQCLEVHDLRDGNTLPILAASDALVVAPILNSGPVRAELLAWAHPPTEGETVEDVLSDDLVPDQHRSFANGFDAYDETGAHYRQVGGLAVPNDVAREVKRGAKVGTIEDWGMPVVRWLNPPTVGAESSDRLKILRRWIEAEVAQIPPRDDVEIHYTLWRGSAHEGTLVLIELSC